MGTFELPSGLGIDSIIWAKKPSPRCSLERRQEIVASSSSFQELDSYCNELVLVEEILVQVMRHKQAVSCEMLSCAPFGWSPWPYCLMRTTLIIVACSFYKNKIKIRRTMKLL